MGATGLIAIFLVAATVAASMWRSNDDAAIWSIMSFFSIWLCFFYTSVGLEISSIWRSIWNLKDKEARIQHTAAAAFMSLVSALILVGVAPVGLEFLGWKFLLIITVLYIFLQSLRWSFYLVNGKSDPARPE
ncbi:hypothetical protein G7054_g14742 [Neopestalotiopsis clavispora]|nr:hypothetical protein G7054_g14742 [Neopestalotiopsis clavispora]